MRDFRDAKTMAQTLRESLTTKSVTISHSESLELVSRMFGLADWNTLSAMLQSTRRDATTPAGKRPREATSYPAIPLRDFIPFPSVNFAIYVGRGGCKGSYIIAPTGRRHDRHLLGTARSTTSRTCSRPSIPWRGSKESMPSWRATLEVRGQARRSFFYDKAERPAHRRPFALRRQATLPAETAR